MRLFIARRDPEAAVDLAEAFLATLPPAIERLSRTRIQRQLGVAYRELGADWADRTEKYLELALREFERIGCPQEVAETKLELGTYWWLVDEEETARRLFTQAKDIYRTLGCEVRAVRVEKLLERP